MKVNVVWALGCVLMAGAALAQTVQPPPSTDARQLWQLVDYVAVDYGGAVANGAVVSETEYAEMRDFTDNATKQGQALATHAQKEAIVAAIGALREAVLRKADGGEVSRLARHANKLLIAAYPIPVAPKSLPDLARGATLYATQCASCHGDAGRGDGPLAARLDPKPIAFSDADRARERSLMALYQIVSQGVEGTSMASFGALPEADRWALAFHIGTLSNDDTMRSRGQQIWTNEASARSRFPDLEAVTTLTEASAAEGMSVDTARDVTAYLRRHPDAVAAGKSSSLGLARLRLQESLAALRAGDTDAATRLGLSAYLDGFEPIEPALGARNKALLTEVENAMLAYRSAVTRGTRDQAESAVLQLDRLFARVESELAAGGADPMTTFVGALTILLREGVEALLIVVGMVAFLRKAQRPDVLRHVHAGWIAALAAGALTWVVATYLVGISGASREVTEGVSSLFAAIVLLSVGLWMHKKSSAGRWQAYLKEKLSAAMSRRSAWALFALSFVAVYREVFETVLFYSALAADGNGGALLAGLLIGIALLAVIAWFMLRTSARMPIGKFFSLSSVLVAVLSVVLAGKGVAGLQEAGWIGVTQIMGPRIDVMGVYPTTETLLAQLLVLLVALAGFGVNTIKARQPQRV